MSTMSGSSSATTTRCTLVPGPSVASATSPSSPNDGSEAMWPSLRSGELRSAQRLSAPAHVLGALLAGRHERHHRPQLGTDLLHLVLGTLRLQRGVVGTTVAILRDPLVGELPGLDLLEDP